MSLNNFNDFVQTLLTSGFSLGGGNSEGIYTIIAEVKSDRR